MTSQIEGTGQKKNRSFSYPAYIAGSAAEPPSCSGGAPAKIAASQGALQRPVVWIGVRLESSGDPTAPPAPPGPNGAHQFQNPSW